MRLKMLKKISNKPTNEPVKPEATQAAGKPMPILKYISKMNSLYGNSKTDEYGNEETATTRIQEQDKQQKDKPKKMSASRSWQIIKQSMNKEELEDHYKRHPEDRPIKTTPMEYDKGLTILLGDKWLTE